MRYNPDSERMAVHKLCTISKKTIGHKVMNLSDQPATLNFTLSSTLTAVRRLIFKSIHKILYALLQGLRLAKLVVHPFLLNQLHMSTLLNDSTLVQHKDPICVFDGRKSMSNGDSGTAS
jgi:hypothetical protein